MIPQFRYLTTKYPKPTAAEVIRYREEHCCGLNEAVRELTIPDKRVLQWRIWELHCDNWQDVPEIVEYV